MSGDWKMELDTRGLDGLYERVANKINETMSRAVDALMVEAADRARQASFVDRSGNTRRSIEGGILAAETNDVQITGFVKAAGAARFIDGGTVPHEIVPRPERGGRGRLRFETVGGNIVFAKKVNHPGTQPNPFITTAMSKNEFQLRMAQAFGVAMKRWIEETQNG